MPLQQLVAAFQGISTGLLALGGGLTVLTLAGGGITMYFSWMDTHIGGLIKRILLSSLAGGVLLGGSGAIGLWLASQFGM